MANRCPGTCRPRYEVGEPCTVERQQCSVPYGICLEGMCHIPVEAGESCADDLDCQRDLLCDSNEHTCVEPALRPGLGETCINDFNGGKPALLCQPGLYCFDDGIDRHPGVCEEVGSEGEACEHYRGCENGLNCTALAGGPRLCHGTAAEGEPCDLGHQPPCEAGLNCTAASNEANTQRCSPKPAFGEACFGSGTCAEGLTCELGVCLRTVYPGDACDEATAICASSRCVSGVCELRGRLGDACHTADDCLFSRCTAAGCAVWDPCPP